MPANVRTSQTPTTWTRTTVEPVRGLMYPPKKTVPQRCSSIAFDFFDLSSSNLVQESSVDLWDNLNKVRGLPHNALHFPSYYYYYSELNLLYLRIPQQGRTLIEGVSIERLWENSCVRSDTIGYMCAYMCVHACIGVLCIRMRSMGSTTYPSSWYFSPARSR